MRGWCLTTFAIQFAFLLHRQCGQSHPHFQKCQPGYYWLSRFKIFEFTHWQLVRTWLCVPTTTSKSAPFAVNVHGLYHPDLFKADWSVECSLRFVLTENFKHLAWEPASAVKFLVALKAICFVQGGVPWFLWLHRVLLLVSAVWIHLTKNAFQEIQSCASASGGPTACL